MRSIIISLTFLSLFRVFSKKMKEWEKILNFDGLLKRRHTREGGYPERKQIPKKTGFPDQVGE